MRRIHRFTVTFSSCSRDGRVLSNIQIMVSLILISFGVSDLSNMFMLFLTSFAHMFLPLRYQLIPGLHLRSVLQVGTGYQTGRGIPLDFSVHRIRHSIRPYSAWKRFFVLFDMFTDPVEHLFVKLLVSFVGYRYHSLFSFFST